MFKHHDYAWAAHDLNGVGTRPTPRPIQAAEQKLKDAHAGLTSQETDPKALEKQGFDQQTFVENRMQFEGTDPTTQARLKQEFETFDADGDGVMNEHEFLTLMQDRAAGGNLNVGDYTDGTAEQGDLTAAEVQALNTGVKPKSAETLAQQQQLNAWLGSDAGQKYLAAHPEAAKAIGGTPPKLAEDGKEGPKTRAAQRAMEQAGKPPAPTSEQPADKQVPPTTQTPPAAQADPAQAAFIQAQTEPDPTKRTLAMAQAAAQMNPPSPAAQQLVKAEFDKLEKAQMPATFKQTLQALADAKVDLGKAMGYEARQDLLRQTDAFGGMPGLEGYVAHSLLKDDLAAGKPMGAWKQYLGEDSSEQLILTYASHAELQQLSPEDRATLRDHADGRLWTDAGGERAITKLDNNDPALNPQLKQPTAP